MTCRAMLSARVTRTLIRETSIEALPSGLANMNARRMVVPRTRAPEGGDGRGQPAITSMAPDLPNSEGMRRMRGSPPGDAGLSKPCLAQTKRHVRPHCAAESFVPRCEPCGGEDLSSYPSTADAALRSRLPAELRCRLPAVRETGMRDARQLRAECLHVLLCLCVVRSTFCLFLDLLRPPVGLSGCVNFVIE